MYTQYNSHDLTRLCCSLNAVRDSVVVDCKWRCVSKRSVFCSRSPQSVPHVSEHKDACSGGEHHSHVPENPAKADQTPGAHEQEEQGEYFAILRTRLFLVFDSLGASEEMVGWVLYVDEALLRTKYRNTRAHSATWCLFRLSNVYWLFDHTTAFMTVYD